MTVRLFQVDAFADAPFRGNPAAVCPLDAWLPDATMQAVAEENNLSETAFIVPDGDGDGYGLRWFTPRHEVDLCGHATLAAAFVLFTELEPERTAVRFATRGGPLTVEREGDLLAMDFPALPPEECAVPPTELLAGLGAPPAAVLVTPANFFAVYEREAQVRAVRPDLALLEALHPRGAAVTAPGDAVDVVSRYFAPSFGIPEDPVTGSTHATLVSYWARRLGKPLLHARQLSARGGDLFCQDRGDRVRIAGRAVLYLRGTISL